MNPENPKKKHHVNKIPLGSLDDIIEGLKALKPDGSKKISGAKMMKPVAPFVRAAFKKGITAEELSAFFLGKGVELQASTIRSLVRKKKRIPKVDPE